MCFTENGLVAFKDRKLIGHEVEHSSSAGCLEICNPIYISHCLTIPINYWTM
jgi:hypothetical protein